MIKIATILSFLVFQTLYCQSVLSKFPLKGSLLCGEKTYGVTLFGDTSIRFRITNRSISADTLLNTITVKYNLDLSNPLLKNDTIFLNELVTNKSFSLLTNPTWTIKRVFNYKNFAVKSDTTISYFNPYGVCFKVNYNCDSISFEKNSLEPNCSNFRKTGSNKYTENINDTIIATYIDSLVYSQLVCLAIGFKHEKSIATYKQPKNKVFNLKTVDQNVYVGAFPAFYDMSDQSKAFYLGKVDLTGCIPTAVDDVELKTTDVYPNPASEKVYITSKPEIIQLIDIYGQKHSIKGNGSYDLSEIKAGMYLLQYEAENQKVNKKLIIK